MHIVEVRRPNADLAAAMAEMRTWLDNQAIQPSLFEIAFLAGRRRAGNRRTSPRPRLVRPSRRPSRALRLPTAAHA